MTYNPGLTPAGANQACLNVYLSGNQIPSTGVITQIAFDTALIDSLGDFDTGTHIWTPSIAGYYFVTLSLYAITNAGAVVNAFIYKNGAAVDTAQLYNAASVSAQITRTSQAVVQMNGTSDYVDFYGQCYNASPRFYGNIAATKATSFFLHG